jgi:hypothetical protein
MAKKDDGGKRIGADVVRATRDRKLIVWASDDEYAFLTRAARAAGLPLSTYVRASALALAKVQLRQPGTPPWDATGGNGPRPEDD